MQVLLHFARRARAALPFVAAFAVALVWGLWPARAQASIYLPNCTVAQLVAAINDANATPVDLDTILLPSGCTYTLTAASVTEAGNGATGLPYITSPIIIDGNGATFIRDGAAPPFRLMFSSNALTISRLTFTNGLADNGTTGSENDAGAILSVAGSLTIADSTFINNRATDLAGTILGAAGVTVTVTGSTFFGNSANYGGAIYAGTSSTIANSTFSSNRAFIGYGGAVTIPFGGTATIAHSTFTGNLSSADGAVYNAGKLTLVNTVVAKQATGVNCGLPAALEAASGFNLADDATCGSEFTQVAPDVVRLGSLAANGGPTMTHSPLAQSALINAGDPNFVGAANDQRGDDFLSVRDGRTDIGAVEADAAKVGGAVTGLLGSGLTLTLNGGFDLPIAADGPFTFSPWLVKGNGFGVAVKTQPLNRPQICTVSNGAGTITGDEVTNVAVACALDQRTLTVARAGSGTGTVSSSPAAIACGLTCGAPIDRDTVVTLTAAPAASSTFGGWAGDCTGGGACVVTMSAARSVTATFTIKTYALTVGFAGTGIGAVFGRPADPEQIAHGTVVTLTAVPLVGSTFAGWSGACSGAGACLLTMDAAKSVTATFTLNTYALTVTKAGTGSGTVQGAPANPIAHGTVVTLTATAATGSAFAGWSGDCEGTGACVVEMTQARSVTATFAALVAMVEVTVTAPGGGGTVTVLLVQPDAAAATLYPVGATLRLTAIPDAGFVFAGWGGDLDGYQTPTEITVSEATTITASFSQVRGWLPGVTSDE